MVGRKSERNRCADIQRRKDAGYEIPTLPSETSVQTGRWQENKLVTELEVWQCDDAVIGATEAAEAARTVKVGGGKLADALLLVLKQPILWATAVSVVINMLNKELPPTVRPLPYSCLAYEVL